MVLQIKSAPDEPITYKKQADFKIYFPVDNADLHSQYMGNATLLNRIAEIIDSIAEKPNMRFLDFRFAGIHRPTA